VYLLLVAARRRAETQGMPSSEDGGSRGVNKRAASTIIMLCAIAVAAVVLVHKESAVAVDESLVGAARVPEHDFDEMMLFQEDEEEATHTSHKTLRQAKQAGEVILMQEEPEEPIGSPVTEDTLEPVHASLRTGSLEKYGTDGFASNAVSAAGSEASDALKKGLSESAAYKKAQDAATNRVVSDAAVNGEAPAFSRTIRAAAYAAEMKALKQLEAGESEEAARKVAHAAAQDLIKDQRAVKMSVPVPSTLEEQLSYVDHLWGKMRTRLSSLQDVVSGMDGKECEQAKAAAAAKHQEMKLAVLQASEHIAKGHQSREAMEAQLLQVDVHEAHVQQLMSTPDMALVQEEVQSASTKVAQSKRASATHHQRARQQAHLAEGFLSLAAKSHKAAKEVSLQCQAKHVLAKFGFAEEQMKNFEKLKKQGKVLKKQKKMAKEKATKAEEAKDVAAGKAKKAEGEAEDAKKGQDTAAAEARKAIGEAKNAKNDAAAEEKQLAKLAEQNQALAKAMEVSISQQMKASANQAAYEVMMESSGDKVIEEAKAAARKACVTSMKTIAKSLATGMSEVASNSGKDAQAAMRKAILTVLNVGRPLQAGIVEEAVEYAAKKKMPTVKPVEAPAEPVKPVAPKAEPKAPKAEPKAPKAEPKAPKPVPASPTAQAVDEGKVASATAVASAKKDAEEATKKADAEARALAAQKMANKVAALEAETGKVEVSVQKKTSKELSTKKEAKAVKAAQAKEAKDAVQQAKVQKKIAKKTAKEAAQKETARSIVQAKQKNAVEVAKLAAATAEAEKKQAAAAVAKKKQEELEKKERKVALNKAAGKVLVSAKQAVREATSSSAVQQATEKMNAVVNAAAGKAAEIARAAVAKAGGSKKQQLAAATAAATSAAKAAAAYEASKLGKEASSLAKDAVVHTTTTQSGEEAKQFAVQDEVRAAKSRMPSFEQKLEEKIAAAEAPVGSMDLIQVTSQRMSKALGAAAAKALEQARQHVHTKPALQKAIRKALKPVLNKEISRSASLAATTAGKAAKVAGMDAKATQMKVLKAAQKAAKKAQSAGQRLANVAVRNAMKKSA